MTTALFFHYLTLSKHALNQGQEDMRRVFSWPPLTTKTTNGKQLYPQGHNSQGEWPLFYSLLNWGIGKLEGGIIQLDHHRGHQET